jgi:hypothetical protein
MNRARLGSRSTWLRDESAQHGFILFQSLCAQLAAVVLLCGCSVQFKHPQAMPVVPPSPTSTVRRHLDHQSLLHGCQTGRLLLFDPREFRVAIASAGVALLLLHLGHHHHHQTETVSLNIPVVVARLLSLDLSLSDRLLRPYKRSVMHRPMFARFQQRLAELFDGRLDVGVSDTAWMTDLRTVQQVTHMRRAMSGGCRHGREANNKTAAGGVADCLFTLETPALLDATISIHSLRRIRRYLAVIVRSMQSSEAASHADPINMFDWTLSPTAPAVLDVMCNMPGALLRDPTDEVLWAEPVKHQHCAAVTSSPTADGMCLRRPSSSPPRPNCATFATPPHNQRGQAGKGRSGPQL